METPKDYLMEYIVYDKRGDVLKKGKIKAKRKRNEFEAKAGFGKHIEKKYGNTLGRLEITSCKDSSFEDLFGNMFGNNNGKTNKYDPLSNFGDIFGGK